MIDIKGAFDERGVNAKPADGRSVAAEIVRSSAAGIRAALADVEASVLTQLSDMTPVESVS